MKTLLLYITFVLFWPAVGLGQSVFGTLEGTVKDAETRQAVAGANVTLRSTFMGAATDAQGRFRISKIPPGSYTVLVSILGYQRLTLDGVRVVRDERTSIELSIQPVPLQTEPVIITASRREQSLQEVPVSVATVTARMIADRNNITLDDALRYVPGVNVLSDQVNIRGSSGYNRGVGSRVLVLLDGMPYLTGDTGEINWESIPMFTVDRLEVVKGAGSALYGSSALGGVINVITKEAPATPELRFRMFSGMYDKPRYSEWDWSSKPRFNSGVAVSYAGTSGAISYLVSAGRTVDESYRENDTYHRCSLFAKLKYDLSGTQSLTISGNYIDRSHGNFFWWKSLAEATRVPESQRNGEVNSHRGNLSFAYKEFLSDKFFYTAKVIYFGNFWRDDSLGRVNNVSTSHLFSFDVQATYDLNSSNVLTFGVASNYDKVSANLFGTHPGVGAAAYVQDEVALTAELKLTAGLRFDWQKVSVLNSTAQLNPKFGIVYMPDKETSFRASFGSGFRYPAIGELYIESSTNVSAVAVLPNPDLKPETSLSYEVGVSRSLGQTVSVDLAVYSNDFRNLIEPSVGIKRYRPYPASPVEVEGPVIQFENVTKARIQGVETVVRVEWWKKFLSTDVGYTYTWPLDLADNTVLKFRPRHLLYASGVFSWNALRLSADARYLSRIERIDENLVRLAPIVNGEQRVAIKIVDVRTSYDLVALKLPLRVGLNINNLLNYSYVELLGNLGPVRTYYLTIEGMF
ncbi:MAG: TonB-dependent receptor [Ignavibacteriales bacterium]|nr:TonB-dependent receptor [Ignavibacteriales bacterium]